MDILCFYAGTVFVYLSNTYALLLLVTFLWFRVKPNLILWFLIAIIWSYCHQYLNNPKGMPAKPIIQRAILQGYISSIPNQSQSKLQFEFMLEQLNHKAVTARILLNCYKHCPMVKNGEVWQLMAKLKKPHNLNNPGGFDYVNWLSARHINWTGTIIGAKSIQLNKPRSSRLGHCREWLGNRLANLDHNPITLGITQALTLGLTQNINKNEWGLFRRTGTTHLMVISGAHIGLVASLMFTLVRRLWSLFPKLCVSIPAQKVAGLISFTCALIYVCLAGLGIPAQRSLIVCFVMLLSQLTNHRFAAWQAWRYALLGVLVVEPHAVLFPGFYLSFIAVAVLLFTNQKIQTEGIKKTLVVQLACLLGLLPFTLYWYSYAAINGLMANLVAIPLVGFVIVPMGLLITGVSVFFNAKWLMLGLKTSISILLYLLHWVDSMAWMNITYGLSHVYAILGILLALGLAWFLPIKNYLLIALLLLFCSFLPKTLALSKGEVLIDVLDVGQGLAIAIHTTSHHMLYDTGVKTLAGQDMGALVIIPYLHRLRIFDIDKIILSHHDMDHIGGYETVKASYLKSELIVDNPALYKTPSVSCHDYHQWIWDGVTFEFLPIKHSFRSKNNHSCILKISTKQAQMLLTGDIEHEAESYLIQKYSEKLKAKVLLIPHHGSKTSSSDSFIDKVAPELGIISAGFDNAYHLPNKNIINKYTHRGISVYNTEQCGKISIKLTKLGVVKPVCVGL